MNWLHDWSSALQYEVARLVQVFFIQHLTLFCRLWSLYPHNWGQKWEIRILIIWIVICIFVFHGNKFIGKLESITSKLFTYGVLFNTYILKYRNFSKSVALFHGKSTLLILNMYFSEILLILIWNFISILKVLFQKSNIGHYWELYYWSALDTC